MNLMVVLLTGIGVFVVGVILLGLILGKVTNRRHHTIDLRRDRRRETVEYTEEYSEPEPVSEPEPEEDTTAYAAPPRQETGLPEYHMQFRSKPGRTSPRPYYMPPQEADAARATGERYL